MANSTTPTATGAGKTTPPAKSNGSNGSSPDPYVPHFKGKKLLTIYGVSQKGFLVGLAYEVQTAEDMKAVNDDIPHDLESMKLKPVTSIEESLRAAIENVGEQIGKGIEATGQNAAQEGSSEKPGEYRSVKIVRMKLLYTPNGNPYILVQAVPGLGKHGVSCWEEVYKPVFGQTADIVAKVGVGKEIPIPENASYAVVAYVDGKADKVVEFKATAN